MVQLADIRKEYRLNRLNKEEVAENAMEQFERWWQDAMKE